MGEYVSAREWEAAAEYEYRLWQDVLIELARGEDGELAIIALRTTRYQFPRSW